MEENIEYKMISLKIKIIKNKNNMKDYKNISIFLIFFVNFLSFN